LENFPERPLKVCYDWIFVGMCGGRFLGFHGCYDCLEKGEKCGFSFRQFFLIIPDSKSIPEASTISSLFYNFNLKI
jgi:hypothetical protein